MCDHLNTVFSFGKWRGKKVSSVYLNEPGYIDYLLKQQTDDEWMQVFGGIYVHELVAISEISLGRTTLDLGNMKVKFGKYKGKTLNDIKSTDARYLVWMLNNLSSKYVTIRRALRIMNGERPTSYVV